MRTRRTRSSNRTSQTVNLRGVFQGSVRVSRGSGGADFGRHVWLGKSLALAARRVSHLVVGAKQGGGGLKRGLIAAVKTRSPALARLVDDGAAHFRFLERQVEPVRQLA